MEQFLYTNNSTPQRPNLKIRGLLSGVFIGLLSVIALWVPLAIIGYHSNLAFLGVAAIYGLVTIVAVPLFIAFCFFLGYRKDKAAKSGAVPENKSFFILNSVDEVIWLIIAMPISSFLIFLIMQNTINLSYPSILNSLLVVVIHFSYIFFPYTYLIAYAYIGIKIGKLFNNSSKGIIISRGDIVKIGVIFLFTLITPSILYISTQLTRTEHEYWSNKLNSEIKLANVTDEGFVTGNGPYEQGRSYSDYTKLTFLADLYIPYEGSYYMDFAYLDGNKKSNSYSNGILDQEESVSKYNGLINAGLYYSNKGWKKIKIIFLNTRCPGDEPDIPLNPDSKPMPHQLRFRLIFNEKKENGVVLEEIKHETRAFKDSDFYLHCKTIRPSEIPQSPTPTPFIFDTGR